MNVLFKKKLLGVKFGSTICVQKKKTKRIRNTV